MGEIVNDSLLGELNGQIGNMIVSHKGKTKYVKLKGKKKNNHTKPREKTENRFSDLSHQWTGLPIKEKRTWFKLLKSDHKFKNKEKKDVTDARNLFISLNRNMQEIGEPINRTAPVYAEPQSMFNAKVEMILKGEELSMNLHLINKIEENTKVIVFATPFITNPSDSINERNYRYITVIDSSFGTGSSIKDEYLKVFEKSGGVGEEFSFKFKTVHKKSGIKGFVISCIVTVIRPENE